jgi:5-methylthioadenosine/S-adenosylhomocysteine deaminase
MFEETRLAALLAKGFAGDPTVLPAREALSMATRLGAHAVHLGDITGSLEPGKRADLIVVDLSQVHNVPSFTRDPNAIYSQIVYAAKSTDVRDVMCNGCWLMRDRQLMTVDEDELRAAAKDAAKRIDAFLITREESVLQKLIAIGGAVEQESFEIQVKAHVGSADVVHDALRSETLTVIRAAHYHQFDTYFFFSPPEQSRLRYREDEFLDENAAVTNVRARLTLTGPSREARFGSVLLFRSRYLAPAAHSRRFYREYFRPIDEREVEKDRRRWLIAYKGVEFYVHLDRLMRPPSTGYFLEVKSRTWSRRDAEDKAAIIADLLKLLGGRPDDGLDDGYVELRAIESADSGQEPE